jgi:hypothetical protein
MLTLFSKSDCIPKKLLPIVSKATPRPAPELIPKTEGPAIGFLKRVCIKSPTADKPAPVLMAVIDFGILKLTRM